MFAFLRQWKDISFRAREAELGVQLFCLRHQITRKVPLKGKIVIYRGRNSSRQPGVRTYYVKVENVDGLTFSTSVSAEDAEQFGLRLASALGYQVVNGGNVVGPP
jgi:hypothetical protein